MNIRSWQCPNCGGDEVKVERKDETQVVRERPLRWPLRWKRLRKWSLWMAGTSAWLSAVYMLALPSLMEMSAVEWFSQLVLGAVMVFLVTELIGLPFILLWKPGSVVLPRVVRQFHCSLCGHRWTWDSTTPYPQVAARPDATATAEQTAEETPHPQ